MLERVLGVATAFIVAAISAGGYSGIVMLMAIESACIPLPSEIIMPFAGYLVYRGELGLVGVSVACAFGCVVRAYVGYSVGSVGRRSAVARCASRRIVMLPWLKSAVPWFAPWPRTTARWSRA